ncbi:biotin synthase BioB [Parasutterella secunda]|jgi:biotin synthase|uniref:biotin synthase BioB n=1 Tax=Parasutterella secunda TaxID=626947 RepID=UPI0025A42732|nr:biotin synthase BioB [Parasutterella secunda]MDM8088217.1 biotin synthase BioB [Parasutterella secunda]
MDNVLTHLDQVKQRALQEEIPTAEDLQQIANAPISHLVEAAHEVTIHKASQVFNFCAIVNAKSGRCSENCHWCAQSRHFEGQCKIYPLLEAKKIIEAALIAQRSGATRFSLVTSGRKLSRREVREAAEIVRELKKETSLEICLSAGLLTAEEFQLLAQAGVCRCHCNLETCENFFPHVCSSHTFTDKLKTIEAAHSAGLDICSGGIIGMGESRQNRIELALTLRKLKICSIPINILEPIKGTPLELIEPISEEEIIRTIALFRLANPKAYLRFAGGRRRLSDTATRLALRAGINSAIAGDLLTTKGTGIEKDKKLVESCGYQFETIA